MSRAASCLSVLLLSEDSGAGACETLRSLAKELLKQVDSAIQTHRITFEPLRNEVALQALHANIWKSTNKKDRQKLVELVRTIAQHVVTEDGWVLFHFDGDCKWGDRESSENVQKFEKIVREHVRQTIEALRGAQAAERLRRLLTVVPFYSIEAWLYQNTREAIRLCEERHQGRDVERFQQWAQDRSLLDEELKPKEQICLRSSHNEALASSGFPAREVHAAGKSFSAVVLALSADAELCEALRRTYMPP